MPRRSVSLDLATPAGVAEAALSVIDEEGSGALSFRAVAARLGVAHATVQRRCTDLAGLLDLCMDHLAADLPDIPPGTNWAESSEIRFRRLYELLTAHPGLVALRGSRPWLGPQLLGRLVEPQLAAGVAVGMTVTEAITAYRRMYLLTLGSASFVDHGGPEAAQAMTRTALAALDPEEFPVLAGHIAEILPVVVDHEVFYSALRQLIQAADPRAADVTRHP